MADIDIIPNPPIGALSISGFCRLYNTGRTRTYELIKSGQLRAVKSGTSTLIRRVDAEAWAASLPVMGAHQ
jgi:excisionase family DNA binding protein